MNGETQCRIYLYNGILNSYSAIKMMYWYILPHKDESCYYAKWKKPFTKDQLFNINDFLSEIYKVQANTEGQKINECLSSVRGLGAKKKDSQWLWYCLLG